MRRALLLALALCGGCVRVYPGDGTLIVVELDPQFAEHTIGTETEAQLISEGIRYWDAVGARLRTRDQLTPDDRPDRPDGWHVNIVYSDLSQGDMSTVGWYDSQGTITMYGKWMARYDEQHIRTLAAHETGHVLGCGHIDTFPSVMYYQITGLDQLTDADIIEFDRAQHK